MSVQRLLLAVSCVFVLMLPACNTGTGIIEPSLNTFVRIVDVIPDAGSLDVTSDGTQVASDLQFQDLTLYQQIPSGTHEVKVTISGTNTNIIDNNYNFLQGTYFTYIIYGQTSRPAALLAVDTPLILPGSNQFQLRVINAAPGTPAVDVYLTTPGQDINSAAPILTAVGYGLITAFLPFDPATMELRFTTTGTKLLVYDSVPQTFAPQSVWQAILYSNGGGSLVDVAMMSNDTTGAGTINSNLLATYKVVNAAAGFAPLSVFLDGVLTLANIPYAGASSYQQTSAMQHTFTVETTTTPGSALVTVNPTLAPATNTSILLGGIPGALTATVLTDFNVIPSAGKARVRFVNASTDVQSFDVFSNFALLVPGLVMNVPAAYIELDGGTTDIPDVYEFDFNVTGTQVPILSMPNVSLVAGFTYSIYVGGPAASLQPFITQDN